MIYEKLQDPPPRASHRAGSGGWRPMIRPSSLAALHPMTNEELGNHGHLPARALHMGESQYPLVMPN